MIHVSLMPGDMMISKKEIRDSIRKYSGPFEGSDDIFAIIETMSVFQDSDVVLLYSSIPGEVRTDAFIEKWAANKTIVLPKVNGDILELRKYDPEHLERGYRGIAEPDGQSPLVKASEIGFAIIPGMAFDARGGRLGRGKGYYDRLLPELECPKAGVAYAHQLVEAVPMEEHDVRMDMVITPNNCYICGEYPSGDPKLHHHV